MLSVWLILIAAAIRFTGSLTYSWAVIKGRAKPNPVSWFFWALTALIVFFAQLSAHVGWSILVTFILGVGPLIVFLLSLKYSFDKSQFTVFTLVCGILAAIGVILWLNTDDPILAIVFSVMADACASLPTIIKAYRFPKTEVPFPYFLSVLSMVVTLTALTDWRIASFAFPAYIFIINAVILASIFFGKNKAKKRPIRKALRSKQA